MPEPEGTEPKEAKEVTVEIDGESKTFTTDDVKNLVAQQASATQKTQQVAAILEAATRYGVSPEEYLENSEGSFALMNQLIDKGVIDEQGNILEKSSEPKPKDPEPAAEPTSSGPPAKKSEDKILETVMKAQMGPLMEKLSRLEQDNVLLMKLRLQDKAQGKFTNLDEGDVARLFTVAEQDRSKPFMQHAEEYSNSKKEERAGLEKEFAEKHGIDLEAQEQKKAFQQDPAGGAAALFKGKKISFKRGAKDAVSPLQATKEYFNKLE